MLIFSFLSTRRGGGTFVPCDKSNQKRTFSQEGRKKLTETVSFSISTLCFTDSFLPSFCFKVRLNKTSPLGCAFTKLSRLSITLRCHYSLPTLSPTVVDRWFGFFSWLGLGGFAVTDGYFGFCWKREAAPSNRLAICGDTLSPTRTQFGYGAATHRLKSHLLFT